MTKSKIFLFFCNFFILGIFLASFFYFNQIFILAFLLLAVSLISVLFSCKKAVLFGFCILFFVLGIFVYQKKEERIISSALSLENIVGTVPAIMEGKVIKEPKIGNSNQKLLIGIKKVNDSSFEGKILLIIPSYPEYFYGDILKIKGNIQNILEIEDPKYSNYLKKEGIIGTILFANIEVKGNEGNFLYSKILFFKKRFKESILKNIPMPQSSVLSAILLGDKNLIPNELNEKFSITGVSHIIAISGMHISIMVLILSGALTLAGVSLKLSIYITFGFLLLFILFIGFPVSALRAGLMGGIVLLAQLFGKRGGGGVRGLIFVAVLILFFNPFLLRFDIGFQLSFLAVLGIVLFSPFLDLLMKKAIKFSGFRKLITVTLSAQIFTFPILLYNFGGVSLIAPIVNVLVVPVLPFVLGLGFLSGITALILPFLGKIVLIPTYLLLSYLLKTIDFFSNIPLWGGF